MGTNSYKNVIETVDIPLIKRGGPSSSTALNWINQRIQGDLIDVNSRSQDLDRDQKLLSVYLEQQAVGIQGLVNSLITLVPSLPGGRGVADFFSTDYIAGDNTANIDEDFGQATLPILSVEEKMHSIDSNGNVWIPSDSRLRFLTQSSYTAGTIPDDSYFFNSVEDYKGIGSQSDTFFLGGYLTSQNYVFLKCVLPQALNTSTLSNRLTFYPIPAFSHELVGAYYRLTDGSWNTIDISYQVGYTTATTPAQVSYLGPTRLHFPASEVTEVMVVMKCTGWWGVQQCGVQLVEYASNALLSVDMAAFSPHTITDTVLSGINPIVLNSYPTTITGTKVQVSLSQTQSLSTPVLTSVDARWSS